MVKGMPSKARKILTCDPIAERSFIRCCIELTELTSRVNFNKSDFHQYGIGLVFMELRRQHSIGFVQGNSNLLYNAISPIIKKQTAGILADIVSEFVLISHWQYWARRVANASYRRQLLVCNWNTRNKILDDAVSLNLIETKWFDDSLRLSDTRQRLEGWIK